MGIRCEPHDRKPDDEENESGHEDPGRKPDVVSENVDYLKRDPGAGQVQAKDLPESRRALGFSHQKESGSPGKGRQSSIGRRSKAWNVAVP